jgi:MFS family permease
VPEVTGAFTRTRPFSPSAGGNRSLPARASQGAAGSARFPAATALFAASAPSNFAAGALSQSGPPAPPASELAPLAGEEAGSAAPPQTWLWLFVVAGVAAVALAAVVVFLVRRRLRYEYYYSEQSTAQADPMVDGTTAFLASERSRLADETGRVATTNPLADDEAIFESHLSLSDDDDPPLLVSL